MDSTDIFAIIVLCGVPTLFISSTLLGFLFWRYRPLKTALALAERKILEQEETIDDIVEREGKEALASARTKISELELKLQESIFQQENMREEHRLEIRNLRANMRAEHQSEIRDLKSQIRNEERIRWLESLATRQYLNEVEVEAKFIYPLVRYLGYSDDRFTLRQSVAFMMGSQEAAGEADWVLWHHRPEGRERKPFVIVEAKAPTQNLDDSVVSQARSYAFAMGAPYYLLTNGRQLMLYKRGVEMDERILAVDSANFAQNWKTLEEEIGV